MRVQGEPGEAVEEPAAVRIPWAPGQERAEGAGGTGSEEGAGRESAERGQDIRGETGQGGLPVRPEPNLKTAREVGR